MKSETIGTGQVVGLLLVSRLATVAAFSPAPASQTEWWSTLLYSVTWCALLIPGYVFARITGDDPLCFFTRRNKWIGKTVAILFGLFCLYILGINASQFIYFVREALSPDMAATVLCIALITASFWSALYGIEALARAAVPLAVALIVSIAAVTVLLVPEIRTGYLAQTLTAKVSLEGWWYDTVRTSEAVLVGFLSARVNRPRFCSSIVIPTFCVAVGMLVIRLTAIGVLGDFSLRCFYPYHTAVTAIGAGDVSRLDALVVSVWVAAMFVKTALFAWGFVQSSKTLCARSVRRFVIPLGALAVWIVGVGLSGRSHTASVGWIAAISAVGLGLFAVGLPLCGCFIVRRKRI